MNEFNHLKNLCEFLNSVDNFNECFVDDNCPYDEAEARALFSEHVFNLLLAADVEEQMANSMSDALTNTFYYVPHEHYKEATALQQLLCAIDAEAKADEERCARNDFSGKFTINIGGQSVAFLVGGPQIEGLCKFVEQIAAENFHEVDFERNTVVAHLFT